MVATIMIVSLIVCLILIGDYPKGELLTKYRWMIVAPVIAILSIVYALFEGVTTSVPSGEHLTKMVKVEDEDGKVYYWNLLIYADKFAYDEGETEVSSYEVRGIISPNDGSIIDVEPYEYEVFGDEASFDDYSNDEYGISYRTTINKQDVEVAVIDRVKAVGIINFIFNIGAMLLAGYAMSCSIRQIKIWKSEESGPKSGP